MEILAYLNKITLTNICWAAPMISCCDFLCRQLMMSSPVSVVHSSLVASSLLASSGEFCRYWSHRAVPAGNGVSYCSYCS